MPNSFAVMFLTLAMAGCGTGVYHNKIEVTINDPSKRLGPEPIEVSVFHKNEGDSEEWARKTMGSTGAGKTYSAEVSATDVKSVCYDRTPPTSIGAGLFLPAFEKNGYFGCLASWPGGAGRVDELPSFLVRPLRNTNSAATARLTSTGSARAGRSDDRRLAAGRSEEALVTVRLGALVLRLFRRHEPFYNRLFLNLASPSSRGSRTWPFQG